ncbi:hypothetical protein D3C81_2207500 [compost metagenome]
MTGQQDHRQVHVLVLQFRQQLKATHAWHAHIAENHPGEVSGQVRQTLLGAAEQFDVEPREAQPLLDRVADTAFVINQDYRVQH